MKMNFQIGEIAKLLDVPAATLRFWETSGLLSIEKQTNNYRSYTTRDIIQIADIMHYRTLGIPVTEVRKIANKSREEYTAQMLSMQIQIADQITKYEKMQARITKKLLHLEEVQRLSQADYIDETVPFDIVHPFDYLEHDKLLDYIEEPSRYVRYFNTEDMTTETRGIISSSSLDSSSPLWQKKLDSHFITFLIREKVNKNYESDIELSLKKIRTRYNTGCLLAQYLVTATENGDVIDYLKAYLEVTPLVP